MLLRGPAWGPLESYPLTAGRPHVVFHLPIVEDELLAAYYYVLYYHQKQKWSAPVTIDDGTAFQVKRIHAHAEKHHTHTMK